MPPPAGYFAAQNWWFWMDGEMPMQSTLPVGGGPDWELRYLPERYGKGYARSVQGWKLHLTCHPGDIANLCAATSPVLRRLGVAHKYFPFPAFAQEAVGAKACTIYPSDPDHLAVTVRALRPILTKAVKKAHRGARVVNSQISYSSGQLRSAEGGIPGDLRLGAQGFIFCRYGAFAGPLADTRQIYDPVQDTAIADPRGAAYRPAFITAIPLAIYALRG